MERNDCPICYNILGLFYVSDAKKSASICNFTFSVGQDQRPKQIDHEHQFHNGPRFVMMILHQEPSERDREYRHAEDDAESGAVEVRWRRHPEFGVDRLNVFALDSRELGAGLVDLTRP